VSKVYELSYHFPNPRQHHPSVELLGTELTPPSLVLGDVYGQLQSVFAKVSKLHVSNQFSLAVVAGNLFAEDDTAVGDLLEGRINIPLPTYFTVGTTSLPQRIIDKIEKDEEV
tara:strand:+ start:323 stop:661 length:339 start_codon:yes stop_codon:yes gene_type:complete